MDPSLPFGDYRGLSRLEERAARGLEWITGAACVAHDRDGRQGVHDFELCYPDGRIAAVEVTSHAGPDVQETRALLGKDNFKLPPVSPWTWLIGLPHGVQVKEFRDRYANVIRVCERERAVILEYLPWDVQQSDPDVRWFLEHGVEVWLQQTQPNEPKVYVIPQGIVDAVDDRLCGLNAAVAELLTVSTISRRLEKVSRARRSERHLFVSLDVGSMPNAVFLGLHRPEAVPPKSAT